MHPFVLATIGGVLIAAASSLNLFLKGRVTGFSGVAFALWSGEEGSNTWRWSLLLGLISSSLILRLSSLGKDTFFEPQSTFSKDFSLAAIILSSIFVGLGTKIGNGCTSGHGVCGLPRFSLRSFVAVMVFLITGIGTATLRHNVPFLTNESFLTSWGVEMYEKSGNFKEYFYYTTLVIILVLTLFYLIILYRHEYNKSNSREFSDGIIGYFVGFIFGLGLCISGMAKRSKVINFLAISSDWDASLLFVLGVSVGINVITFHFILNRSDNPPLSDKPISLKPGNDLDVNLIIGPFLFGMGWGLSGLCPGPVMVNLFLYLPHMVFFSVFFILGQYIAKLYLKHLNFANKNISSNNNTSTLNVIENK
jgi:uncharacterized membrane protein YedE/YeeE